MASFLHGWLGMNEKLVNEVMFFKKDLFVLSYVLNDVKYYLDCILNMFY